VPSQSTAINIYNQFALTVVVNTTTFQAITVHTLNEVILVPGSYTWWMDTFAINQVETTRFLAVQQAAGVSNSTLEGTHGCTIFVFDDAGYDNSASNVSSISPRDLFNNHIILGQTVWYSTFTSANYTSSSGHNYTFTLTSSLDYTVTVGASTATIIRSDVLLDNGVIHLIDGVLWDTSTPAQSTTSSTPTTSTTPNTPSPTSKSTNKSTPSAGLITGVTIGALALLATLALALWSSRRKPAPRGYTHDGAPDSTGMVQPFDIHSTSGPAAWLPRSKRSQPPEARRNTQATTAGPRAQAPAPVADSQAASGRPAVLTSGEIPDTVVDRLLERFTARIDGGGRALENLNEEPPVYHGS